MTGYLFRKPSLRTVAHLAVVWVVIYLACGFSFDRLAPSTWSTPINYQGDTLEVLAFVKAASEGDYIPCLSQNVSRLGAPFKANWDDNPMYEPFVTFFIGLIARWFGLFTGMNAGILLAHLTAATAFFICCRLLRYRLEWASAGAVLFGLLYYVSFCTRGGHLLLAFIFTLPFGILACWLIGGSRRLKAGGGMFWLCVASGLIMGTANPYNLNIFLQLLCLGLAGHYFFGARRRANLICGGATFVAAILGFLAVNAHTLIYWKLHGFNPAAAPRTYAEAEWYALRPLELILPPSIHRFGFLAAIGKYYSDQIPGDHENFSPYLGLIGGAALIWLLIQAGAAAIRRRNGGGSDRLAAASRESAANKIGVPASSRAATSNLSKLSANPERVEERGVAAREDAGTPVLTPASGALTRRRYKTRITAHAPQSLWVLFCAVPGGINCLLALAGIVYFRGGNRFSVYLATISLLFFASRMSSLAAKWKPVWSYTAATIIALIGILDQLPKPDRVSTETVQKAITTEQAFAQAMESRLPRGGMIFQFPAIGFPEGHPVNGMGEYELIRPYLFTRTLRFSYGFNSGRPREMWQHELATLTAAETVKKLEGYGFCALFLNRKAFPDGGQRLVNDLYALGITNMFQDGALEQLCVMLKPSPTPELPHWEDYAQVVFKRGWQDYETIWHSTRKPEATAYFINEGADDRVFQGSFVVQSVVPRHVMVVANEKILGSEELKANEVKNLSFRTTAKHGRNEIVFKSDEPPAVPPGRLFPVTFRIGNLKLTAERH